MSVFLSLLLLLGAIFPNPDAGRWIDGPEAYFATEAERKEWSALTTPEAKAAFIEKYWLLRDPTPGSIRNEFRETIDGRIQYADETFGFGKTTGSRSARGFIFIVFGSPSRADEQNNEREITFHWAWDRERTPDLVKALRIPRLDIYVSHEIRRQLERLHQAAVIEGYRRILAERSIVNPGLVTPPGM